MRQSGIMNGGDLYPGLPGGNPVIVSIHGRQSTRIQFIKRAKELGFSLREILELLSLSLDPATTCVDVKKRAEIKIADIEEKIRILQGMKKALITLTMECKGSGPVSKCPILEALHSDAEAVKRSAAGRNKRS